MEEKLKTRSRVKQMMKYNFNQLFDKPPVFEWPPINYDGNESCCWRTVAEGIIGDKYATRKSLYQYRREVKKKDVTKHKFKRRQGFVSIDKNNHNELLINFKQNCDANGHSKIKSKHHVSFKIREGPSSIGMDQNKQNNHNYGKMLESSLNCNTKSVDNSSSEYSNKLSSALTQRENQYQDNIGLIPIRSHKSPKK